MKRKFSIILIFILLVSTSNLGCFDKIKSLSTKGEMKVHFIDVGQGDSILIQVNNKNMLIDSGSKSEHNKLFNYLKSQNIKTLDYVIATHPHEDHIGNMADIINTYKIENFYAPKIEHTTKTFESMIEALKNKNLKINVIKEGTNSINLGRGTCTTVYSPMKSEYDNLNNYSPIIKIEFGSTSFLLTGDAEVEVEQEVLNKHFDISADVLKLGHHGSTTSTSDEFFKAVNPYITIISVGKDNSYGHPSKNLLSLINKNNSFLYRTDLNGTIVLSSDGVNIFK